MLERLLQKQKDASVMVGIKNLIVLLLWMPVIMILWGVGVGIGVFAYRYGRYGNLPDLSNAASGLDTTAILLIIVAIFGSIAFLYLILANVTFGRETVEASQEQGEEIVDEVDEKV